MRHDPAAMRSDTLRFWGIMSGAIMARAVFAYPFNAWLVAHGMVTADVLGRGWDGSGIEPHEPNVETVPTSATGRTE